MSLEDSQILCNFLPLLREYLPEVSSEIQSDMYSYINNGEAMMDDYVYDLYAMKDKMNTAEEEDDLDAYPLVQVGEEDDYYDGPQESDWDTSDSNDAAGNTSTAIEKGVAIRSAALLYLLQFWCHSELSSYFKYGCSYGDHACADPLAAEVVVLIHIIMLLVEAGSALRQ